MTYRTRNRIRWAVATLACLYAGFAALPLKHTILVTWSWAELLSPDKPHVTRFCAPFLSAIEFCQERAKRLRGRRLASLAKASKHA